MNVTPSLSSERASSRLAFVLGVALIAVLAIAVSTARFGSQPSVDSGPPAAPTADAEVSPRIAPVTPVDVDGLAIELQVDTTRRPLAAVADELSARLAVNPDDHITATLLSATLLAHARVTGELQHFLDAEAVAEAAIALAPDDADAQLAKAAAVAARHDFAGAAAIADAVLAADPGHVGALLIRGDASLETGDVDSAGSFYGAVASRERVAPVVSRLARVAFLEGDPDQAVRLAVESVALAADLPLRPTEAAFYWFQLASMLERTGQVDAAAAALERALAIDPNHGGALELEAGVLELQGRTTDALDAYLALVADGGAADLHGHAARLLAAVGDHDAAAVQLDLALAAAETAIAENPAERRHVAGFLLDHDPELALALVEEDLSTRNDVDGLALLADALLATDRADAADEAIREALATGVVDAALYLQASEIAAALGHTERADRYAAAARSLHPSLVATS